MHWTERAIQLLKDSLEPVPCELNEIDWKSGLSDKTDRLAQHISAFANHLYGGILVYGVNDDGSLFSMPKEQIDEIVKRLGNIAHNNLSNHIQIEHSVQCYEGHNLLFVYIPEETVRRRYRVGIKYFFRDYAPLCDRWILADNSQVPFRVIAEGYKDDVTVIKDEATFRRILESAECPSEDDNQM